MVVETESDSDHDESHLANNATTSSARTAPETKVAATPHKKQKIKFESSS